MQKIKLIREKKGQLNNLAPQVILITTGILVLVLGLILIGEARDIPAISSPYSEGFANETLITVTETGENAACSSRPAASCSFTILTNATSGTVIPTSNYTILGCKVSFTSGNSLGINNSNWNATYSCSYGDVTYTAANKSLTGFDDFADFIPIIVLAVSVSLILGIILTSFALRRRQR